MYNRWDHMMYLLGATESLENGRIWLTYFYPYLEKMK